MPATYIYLIKNTENIKHKNRNKSWFKQRPHYMLRKLAKLSTNLSRSLSFSEYIKKNITQSAGLH